MTPEALAQGMSSLAVGQAAGGALFVLAMGIMVYPLLHRVLQARRQRLLEERIATGHGGGSGERK